MLLPSSLPAIEAALRGAACRAGGVVQLYLAGTDDRLAWAAASADGPDLAALAETLGPDAAVLDLSRVAEAGGVGVGIAWTMAPRGALLALAPGSVPPPGARTRLADAATVLRALLSPPADALPARLLVDAGASPETFDEREATLAAIFDTVPLGLGTLDLDPTAPGGLRLVTANVHAARALGAMDLMARPPDDAAAPDALARWTEACHRAHAAGGVARFSFDARRDGAPRRFVATVAVLDPALSRFSFVAEDVTERDAGERAAAELFRVEASASEARRALLTHVTHELRSPLTAILGYADLLGADSPADEIVEAREVIGRAGGRMLAALDSLGALALVDAGRVTAAAAPVYAGAVVAALAEAHRLPAAACRTTLLVDVALPPDPVLLDPDLFERLVRTLLSAAVAATTDGRIDGRLSVDGNALVFDLRAHPAEPGAGLGPLGADFLRRLVGVMDGDVEEGHGGDAWRWTVRLPHHPVPVVHLPALAARPPADAGSLVVGEGEAVAIEVSVP